MRSPAIAAVALVCLFMFQYTSALAIQCGDLKKCTTAPCCRDKNEGDDCRIAGDDGICKRFREDTNSLNTIVCCTCQGTKWDTHATALQIPDNDPNGVLATISMEDDVVFTGVQVYLEISHTWIGDLTITLTHIETGTEVTLMDRPGAGPGSPQGCSADLSCDSLLVLSDIDENPIDCAEGGCDGCFPGGHVWAYSFYAPTQLLSAFQGEQSLGTWQFRVSDGYEGETGEICAVGLGFLLEDITRTEPTTWGTVKSLYR